MFPFAALDDVRVLDLTRLLPGPMASQWMADLGATVIKVEEPGAGDYMRNMPPRGLFESINRGKKSVAINLKTAEGLRDFLRLAGGADVVMEGFRPGVMDRLGCGWEVLHARNPRLIYIALTGYGSAGPYRDLAGHDINYLAMAGVLDLIGTVPGIQIADLAGGSMQALIGVLGALLERARTGAGRFVDVSMTHGSALMLPVAMAQLANGAAAREGLLSGRYACYNLYPTRDGRAVAVGALEPKFWATLCRALGCEEFASRQFAEDPARTAILQTLRAIFLKKDAEEWFRELRMLDACVTPVRTVAEAAADLGLAAPRQGAAPALGEHTEHYLRR